MTLFVIINSIKKNMSYHLQETPQSHQKIFNKSKIWTDKLGSVYYSEVNLFLLLHPFCSGKKKTESLRKAKGTLWTDTKRTEERSLLYSSELPELTISETKVKKQSIFENFNFYRWKKKKKNGTFLYEVLHCDGCERKCSAKMMYFNTFEDETFFTIISSGKHETASEKRKPHERVIFFFVF
jgi:hypothetical protein